MSSELPIDVAIEPIWVVEGVYAPDAMERRRLVRAEHLRHSAKLRDAGVILETGAFADGTGSLMLVRVADEEAALALFQDDVYVRAGVWTSLRARPFGRLVRPSELPEPG
ncbi:MAG: YciI family protein [Candidatus Limnocylindrales bacterium]